MLGNGALEAQLAFKDSQSTTTYPRGLFRLLLVGSRCDSCAFPFEGNGIDHTNGLYKITVAFSKCVIELPHVPKERFKRQVRAICSCSLHLNQDAE